MTTEPHFPSHQRSVTLKPLVESNRSILAYRSIYDCCVLVVHCPAHQKFALCNWFHSGQHFRWFPFVHMSPKTTWQQVRTAALEAILGQSLTKAAVQSVSCLNVLRIQLPRTERFVTRLIYYVRLEPRLIDLCNTPPQVGATYVQWFAIEEALNGRINNLWGPEVVHYLTTISKAVPERTLCIDCSTKDMFAQVPLREDEMLRARQVTYKDLESIYNDYVEHCFPSFFMSQVAFECFLQKHAIETDAGRLQSYWNAFRPSNRISLSFKHLVMGLVAIDRKTPLCETRLRLIFKFYDTDGDGCLNITELHRLVQDLNPTMNFAQVNQTSNTILNQIKYTLLKRTKLPAQLTIIKKALIGFNTFNRAVRAKIILGTTRLCRARVLVFNSIAYSLVSRRIPFTYNRRHSFKRVITTNSTSSEKCPSCLARNQQVPFRVARHVVLLSESRQLKQVNRRLVQGEQTNQSPMHLGGIDHSVEVQFNNLSLANLYIYLVRLLSHNRKKGDVRKAKGLLEVIPTAQRDQFVADMERLCHDLCYILQREPFLVDIRSPVTVIGDIHGNLEDLLTLEQTLWPTIPFFPGCRYLFLGDYVDRGRWGFECALYLFCLKILAPDKVTLLRGNHEERAIQRNYTYKTELQDKYGHKVASRLFELTNKVFDRLPCCAIVDKRVFCVHGGIPNTNLTESIRSATAGIPREIPTPEKHELVYQMLWSDPADIKTFREEFDLITDLRDKQKRGALATKEDEELSKLYALGYLPNLKRGAACLFNELAFDMFATTNSISHMIRAHEAPIEGYRLHFRRRCITTFSCSHYCGLDNECSVICLVDGRIRIVQMDTSKNSVATPLEF